MTDDNQRFIRWHNIAIRQFGYALNLVLTLAIATLAYWLALLKDKDFVPGPCAKVLMLLSLIALAVSILSALACVVNRLWDFRGSARRASDHPDAPSQNELRELGGATWRLFYIHLFTFAVGVTLLAVTLLLTYGGKLA